MEPGEFRGTGGQLGGRVCRWGCIELITWEVWPGTKPSFERQEVSWAVRLCRWGWR